MKYGMFTMLALCVCAASANGQTPRTDHPLISSYEGSKIRRKDVKDFDEYTAFTGMDDSGKETTGIPLQGKVTKILYSLPKDRSILEIFSNYEMAMKNAGAEILYTCDQKKRECAKQYAGPTLQKAAGLQGVMNTSGRYLLARIEEGEHTAYVALTVGQVVSDIHVVEVKNMEADKVVIDAAALGNALDAKGYVVVEGIFFETDKADLKPTSADALFEMAELFATRPDLNVYIVGHTDSQGSFDHNMSLSVQRAQSVSKILIEQHDIKAGRMKAYGVGPLAPTSTNNSDVGRAQNRRVVLVAR